MAETCARPIRIARENSSVRVIRRSVAASSQTAAAWVTVTSSSTPSAPMIRPASSSPSNCTSGSTPIRIRLTSSVSPVKCMAEVNR